MEKSDVVYLASPLLLVMLVVSWHGAHDVAKVLIGIMVIMIPMLYYIVYAERFDQYWVRREASRPAEVSGSATLHLFSVINVIFLLQLYFEDTLVVVVAKIRLYASSKRDMRPMLKSLRDKVRRVQYDLVEIINLGIVKALLASYTENPDFTTVRTQDRTFAYMRSN